MIGDRYLNQTEEQVYGIYERELNSTEYIGRLLVSKHTCIIMKGKDMIALSWKDIDLINSVRPKE